MDRTARPALPARPRPPGRRAARLVGSLLAVGLSLDGRPRRRGPGPPGRRPGAGRRGRRPVEPDRAAHRRTTEAADARPPVGALHAGHRAAGRLRRRRHGRGRLRAVPAAAPRPGPGQLRGGRRHRGAPGAPAAVPRLRREPGRRLRRHDGRAAPGRREVHGVRVGEAAAATMLASRVGDGRDAVVSRAGPTRRRPGVGADAARVRPHGVRRARVRPPAGAVVADGGGAARAGRRDQRRVRRGLRRGEGAAVPATGLSRTDAQSATAVFWNANVLQQYHLTLGATRCSSGTWASSRARAPSGCSGRRPATRSIACWRAKYDYAYWRPVTAIRAGDTDGNAATVGRPGLDSARPQPAVPGLPERARLRHGRRVRGPAGTCSARTPSTSTCRSRRTRHVPDAALRHLGRARRRDHGRPDPPRSALPPGDDRRQHARPRRGRRRRDPRFEPVG